MTPANMLLLRCTGKLNNVASQLAHFDDPTKFGPDGRPFELDFEDAHAMRDWLYTLLESVRDASDWCVKIPHPIAVDILALLGDAGEMLMGTWEGVGMDIDEGNNAAALAAIRQAFTETSAAAIPLRRFAFRLEAMRTWDEEHTREDQATYAGEFTCAAVRAILGISKGTLANYAKLAVGRTPARGQHGFLYTGEEVKKIAEHAATRSRDQSVISKAQTWLEKPTKSRVKAR